MLHNHNLSSILIFLQYLIILLQTQSPNSIPKIALFVDILDCLMTAEARAQISQTAYWLTGPSLIVRTFIAPREGNENVLLSLVFYCKIIMAVVMEPMMMMINQHLFSHANSAYGEESSLTMFPI